MKKIIRAAPPPPPPRTGSGDSRAYHGYTKKLLCSLVILCGILAAAFTESGALWLTEQDNNGLVITGYTGADTAVAIPEQIQGVPVVAVRGAAKKGGILGIKVVQATIPASVTSIGNFAFMRNQLTGVTLSFGVVSIGQFAFAYNQLTDVTIPGSVTEIRQYAFANNQLASVSLPEGVVAIGDYAFYLNQLRDVTIPGSVTAIGTFAFHGNALTRVVIPAHISLGKDALPHGFAIFYAEKNKQAGAYAYANNAWTYSAEKVSPQGD
jgi:hypothetical protein